jgi:hypothetical protein
MIPWQRSPAGAPQVHRRGRAMTLEQKQLLRTVPVGMLIVVLILYHVSHNVKVFDRNNQPKDDFLNRTMKPEEIRRISDQVLGNLAHHTLPIVEEELHTEDYYVELLELTYPALEPDGKKDLDRPIVVMREKLERIKREIVSLKGGNLPDEMQTRLSSAEAKCDALLERLNRFRPADVTAAGKDR